MDVEAFVTGKSERYIMSHIESACAQLDAWIEHEGFKGYEPHDALNSPILHKIGSQNRLLGVACLQMFRRSPVNLRTVFAVKKDYNSKGMGLFLSSYLKKYQFNKSEKYLKIIYFLIDWLQSNAIKSSCGYNGYCWGYNFDWPNRATYIPKATPTIVNTAFAASALLDGYECLGDNELLSIAVSASDFIRRNLNVLEDNTGICFSYTPLDRRYVYNASLLGAILLARVYSHSQERELLDSAEKAVRFVIYRQRSDGSWAYGENSSDNWVDNFHTGFILVSLADFMYYCGLDDFMPNLEKGYQFYKNNFFLLDGSPKYYPNQIYPIDVHSLAQSILTFWRFRQIDPDALEYAYKIALWGIENMQDEKGYFHYQIHRFYRIKIPYIRWGQAWMQRALTEFLTESSLPLN